MFDELVLGKEKEIESPSTILTTLSVDVKDYDILGVATSSGQRAKESSTTTHGSQPGREPFHDNPIGSKHTQEKLVMILKPPAKRKSSASKNVSPLVPLSHFLKQHSTETQCPPTICFYMRL